MSYQTPPQQFGRQQIEIPAGQAFKAGFFAYFGMMCAAAIVGVIGFGIALLLGLSILGSVNGGM